MKRDGNVIGDDIALVPLAAANTEIRALQPEAAACDDTAVALRGSCQRHGDRTRLAADRQCALHFVAIGTDALDRAAGKQDRKSVVSGKSVSVRVDLGGRRLIKKNTYFSYTDTTPTDHKVTTHSQ